MSDPRNNDPVDYEQPRDNDASLLFLGIFAGIGVLAVLLAAGYGIVAFVMRGGEADLAALDTPVPAAVPDDSAVSPESPPEPADPTDITPAPSEAPVVAVPDTPPPAVASTTPEVVTPNESPESDTETRQPVPTERPDDNAVAAVTPAPQPTEPVEESKTPEAPKSAPEPEPTDMPETPAVTTVEAQTDVPAKPAPVVPEVSNQGRTLAYRWTPGEIHSYKVTLSTNADNQQQLVSGNVELTVQETQPRQINVQEQPADDDDTVTGTGTGFVISADGYLVTCAHVIQGANRIEVQLGESKYEASVVAVEPDDDLALIRIDAQGLAPLALADSEKVKLGEEIRAVGFPLSSVLGDGVKVTTGTIAGIVQREDGKRLQVDAAINPGNSGGPVINSRGQVVGVASSKLIGLELTGVGFSVPSERVLALLSAQQIKPAAARGDAELSGPALVEAVSPSVGLITVSIESVKASGKMVSIRTSGSFRTKQANGDNRRRILSPFSSMSNYTFDRSGLVVDSHGHVGSYDAPNQLPFLAGPMGLLAIHPFDRSGRSSWTVREQVTITIQQNDDRFGPRMPRMPIPRLPRGFGGPRGFNPFGPREVKKLTAVEVNQYRIKSDSDDEVVLEKTFSLTTLDDDRSPYFHISGTGDVKFSRLTGLVESFEFNHNFTRNGGEKPIRVPVKIKVEREPSEVVAKRKRELAIQSAKTEWENAQKAAAQTDKPPGERLDEILVSLHDELEKERGNPHGPIDSLKKLAVIPERQTEVEQILLKQLASSDRSVRTETLRALVVWGTSESVPDLIGLISNNDRSTATGAMAALGAIGDERAVDPLLNKLTNLSFQNDIQNALSRLGPAAEAPVIARLPEVDRNTVRVLCNILGKIGGEESLKVLEEMKAGKDFFHRTFASHVIETVRKRVEARKLEEVPDGQTLTNADIQVVDALKTLDDPNSNDVQKLAAVSTLAGMTPAEFKRDEVESRLNELLDYPNGDVRQKALLALTRWASEASGPGVLKIALQKDTAQRSTALQILGRVGTQAEADALVELLTNPALSPHALTLTRRTGLGPAAEQKLGMLLQGELPTATRRGLIDLLAKIGTAASLVALDALADEPQASTLQYAAAKAAAQVRLRTGIPFSS